MRVEGQVVVRLKEGKSIDVLRKRWDRERKTDLYKRINDKLTISKADKKLIEETRAPLKIKSLRNQNLLTNFSHSSPGGLGKKKVGSTSPLRQAKAVPEAMLLEYDVETDLDILIEELRKDPDIDYCEPNYVFRLKYIPNDSKYPNQWGHPFIRLPMALDTTTATKGSGQVVAVLDTGCDIYHEDLADNIWINPGEIPGNGIDDDGNGYIDDIHGWSIVNNSPTQLNDYSGHGTHVSGIIAAVADNTVGIAGVAPNAKIMVVKVFQADGTASLSDLIEAIDYAYYSGATVVNMSFGGPESLLMEDALKRLYSQAVLVASAGNDWSGTPEPPAPLFPASLDFVIAVGASDQSDNSASFSNWGDVYAPGISVISTLPNNTYAAWSGTSMAAPYVSGLAALYRAHDPSKSIDITSAQLIQGNSHFASNPNPVSRVPILGPRVDAMDILTTPTLPNVDLFSYEVSDPAPGGNGDGVFDAGETVLVNVTLKNYWDTASNVEATLTVADAENSSVSQDLCNYATIGAFATKDSTVSGATQFEVNISSDAPHGLLLPFDLSISYDGLVSAKSTRIYIEANRATTFSGFISEDMTWTRDRLWRITDSVLLNEGYTLTIEPGAKVVIDEGAAFNSDGTVIAVGTKDARIEITGEMVLVGENNILKYVKYTGPLDGRYLGSGTHIENCEFYRTTWNSSYSTRFSFRNLTFIGNIINGGDMGIRAGGYEQRYESNLFININDRVNSFYGAVMLSSAQFQIKKNIFMDNVYHVTASSTNYTTRNDYDISDNFFFENSSEDLSEHIYDRSDDVLKSIVLLPANIPQPKSEIPTSAPPVVAEILFDRTEPVGTGQLEATIVFSKPMDTTTSPFVTFGSQEPYTQKAFSGSWSDSQTWVGTAKIDRYVSDGINQIYVADTRDEMHYMPLVARTWGSFEISTATIQALGLQANPGPGTIELSWQELLDEQSVGVNIYRSTTSGGGYQKINSTIVTGTSYTDRAVNQGTRYYYITRDVTASLEESPDSSEVSAMPGDAIAPVITHTPPAAPNIGGQPYIVATITDNIEVTGGFVKYRIGQTGDYEQLAMEHTSGSLWRAQLPAATVEGYTYYIEATDGINTTLWQSGEAPYALAVSGAPSAGFSANPLSGNSPLLVQFTDQSVGGATSWQWDFNDDGGIDATQQHPSYVYTQPGVYTVRQIATNAAGSHSEVKTNYIVVSETLVCDFIADKRAGAVPLMVQFNDQSSGNPQQWAWDFDGDGSVDSYAQNPSYTYNAPGLYDVSLTVNSPNSTDTKTLIGYIAVYSDATAPQPNFAVDESIETRGSRIRFKDLSAGGVTSWEWDFNGDGIIDSTEQNPTYTFTKPGKFDVSLTVTNGNGTTEIVKNGAVLIYDTSIAYQGRLRMNGQKADGSFRMKFRLFEHSTGGEVLWAEEHESVQVNDGLFSVYLGDTVPISEQILDDSSALYLEVEVYTSASHEWYTLTPRFRLSNTIRSRQLVK